MSIAIRRALEEVSAKEERRDLRLASLAVPMGAARIEAAPSLV
jgi:hypothetical protein